MSSQAAKPTAKTRKAAAGKSTVASVAGDLQTLEKRLKRTDAQTDKAMKALNVAVTDLSKSTQTAKTTQKAALTRGLNALEKKLKVDLETSVQQMRAAIRDGLARVTASGADLNTLEQALVEAHSRLDTHDMTQREAVARLNRHIADLAAAVDARLVQESQARQTESARLSAKLEQAEGRIGHRIDRVEDDTADALTRIGDKVAEFAAVLDDRSKQSDAETAERLADLAQETQSDFNNARTDVTTRLEALETIAAEWSPAQPAQTLYPANLNDPRVEQMSETLQHLQDEMSRLHARLASVQPRPDPAPAPAPAPAHRDSNVVPLSMPQAAMAAPLPTLRDDNPYAAAYAPPASPLPALTENAQRETHIPVEFDPQAFASQQTPPPLPSPPPAAPSLLSPQIAPQMPPQGPPLSSLNGLSPAGSAIAEPLRAPQPVETFENPAYADRDEMRAERVGISSSRKPSLPTFGKSPLSGRNLRIGALATGVAVVGLFAARSILGGAPATDMAFNDPVAPSRTETAQTEAARTETAEAMTYGEPALIDASGAPVPTPPLGTYEEAATPVISADGQATLEAAVTAGNPIAQFQMGLAKLQSGDTAEAARLIRLAANRNQPAAQYRLAKLYETGTGVAKDPITARELVERAALGGNRIAMHDLGNYNFYGQGGLERDPAEALDWFTKAAERGVVDSQFNVAFLREGGQGISPDLSVAYFWYNIAARQGDQGAPGRIAEIGPQLDDATRQKIETDAARFTPKPVDEAANGLFRDVPWAVKTVQGTDSARSARMIRVKTAQSLLTDLGFDIGGADGAAGPKTKAAVREFQKVNGLPETGEISQDLIDRLEVAAGV